MSVAALPVSGEGERRSRAALAIFALASAVEIAGGLRLGSTALMSEGLHASTHVAALGLAAWAYAAQRSGVGVGGGGGDRAAALAALCNGVLLGGIAASLGVESVDRMLHPVVGEPGPALLLALFGLAVSGACAWLLHGGPGWKADLTLASVRLHVASDIAVGVLAVAGLCAGRLWGAPWADPAAGLLGSALVGWTAGVLAMRALKRLSRPTV